MDMNNIWTDHVEHVRAFLADKTVPVSGATLSARELRTEYQEWCWQQAQKLPKGDPGRLAWRAAHAVTATGFGKAMRTLGHEGLKVGGGRMAYRGLAPKDSEWMNA